MVNDNKMKEIKPINHSMGKVEIINISTENVEIMNYNMEFIKSKLQKTSDEWRQAFIDKRFELINLQKSRKNEYIICAAVYYKNDQERGCDSDDKKTGFPVCGRRHSDCYIVLFKIVPSENVNKGNAVEGFMTSTGRFVNRKEAVKIAFDVKQIKEQADILISEDLY